jgi:hypothetical protein
VSLLRTSAKSSRNIDHHGSVNTTLSGRQLTLSRIVWAVLVVLILVIFFAGIPLFYAQYQTVCESLVCNISPQQAQTLRQFGISIKGLALANLAFALLWACTWFAIGAVLAWHKSNDWMGLLVSGMLILQGTTGVTVVTRASSSIWQLPSTLLNDLAFVVVSLVFFLFPDGRFVPRWTRWIVVLLVIVGGLDVLFPDVGVFYSLLTLGSIVCLVVAQLYRYWRISNQTQRQQTRWVVYSISVMVVFNILLASPLLLPAFSPPGSVYFLFAQPLLMLTALLFPISIGIAILRYQLWDIDIIIHRTLVYSLLTFLVVGIYVLIVGGLGTVLQVQGNLVLSLLATGLIAVLFQPLRIFLQRRQSPLIWTTRRTLCRHLAIREPPGGDSCASCGAPNNSGDGGPGPQITLRCYSPELRWRTQHCRRVREASQDATLVALAQPGRNYWATCARSTESARSLECRRYAPVERIGTPDWPCCPRGAPD